MVFNSCVTGPGVNGNVPPTLPDPSGQTDVVADGLRMARDLQALGSNVDDVKVAQYVADRSFAVELAEQVTLNPGAVKGRIPVMRNAIEWLYDPQAPTNFRNFLQESKKRGDNLINALPLYSGNWTVDSSRLNLVSQVERLGDAVHKLLERQGVADKATRDAIFVRSIEEGTNVYGANLGITPELDEFLQRHQAHYNSFLEKNGISGEAANQLKELSTGYIMASEVARKVAVNAGLDVGDEGGIGFVHRVLSPETRRALREQKSSMLADAVLGVTTEKGFIDKSRQVYDFTPADQYKFAQVMGFDLPDGTTISTAQTNIANYTSQVADYAEGFMTPDPRYQVQYDDLVSQIEQLRPEVENPIWNNTVLDLEIKVDDYKEGLATPDPKISEAYAAVAAKVQETKAELDNPTWNKQVQRQRAKLDDYVKGLETPDPKYQSVYDELRSRAEDAKFEMENPTIPDSIIDLEIKVDDYKESLATPDPRYQDAYDAQVERVKVYKERLDNYGRTVDKIKTEVEAFKRGMEEPWSKYNDAYKTQLEKVRVYARSYKADKPGYSAAGLKKAREKLAAVKGDIDKPNPKFSVEKFEALETKLREANDRLSAYESDYSKGLSRAAELHSKVGNNSPLFTPEGLRKLEAQLERANEKFRNGLQKKYDDLLAKAEAAKGQVSNPVRKYTPEGLETLKAQVDQLERDYLDGVEAKYNAAMVEAANLYNQLSNPSSKYSPEGLAELEAKLADARNKQVATLTEKYNKLVAKADAAQAKIGNPDPKYNQATMDQMYEKLEKMQVELEAQLQEPLMRVARLLDDEGYVLQDVIKGLSDEKLNRLVDDGTFAKLPMPSRRLYDYMLNRYNLPFKSMSELMEDPISAYRHYVKQLQSGMKNSVMTQSVVRGAAEYGWGVSRTAFLERPDLYSEFVSMKDVLLDTGFDHRTAGFKSPAELSNLYVHPDVANQYIAALDLSVHPAAIHALVKTIHQMSKTSMLTSASFVIKNLFGAMVSGWQAGMDITAYPFQAAKSMWIAAHSGRLDILDDVSPRYGGLTERQLYLEAIANGLIDGTNAMGEGVSGSVKNLVQAPESLVNRARYIKAQLDQGRFGRAMTRTTDAIQGGLNDMLSPLLFTTMVMEDAAKFTALKTALDNTPQVKFMATMSGSHFRGQSLQEAFTHVKRHFIDFSDTNRVDGFLRSTVFPFWMYTSRNLPLQIRYAMREPGRFMSYYRLASLMNEQRRAADEDFPEDGQNPWDADGMPWYFKQGEHWLRMGRETFDPMLEAFSTVTKTFVDTSHQQEVERLTGERTDGQNIVDYIISQTYGTIKSAVAIVTKEDPFTGAPLREEQSLLGFPVPSVGGMPAGVTRYVLENNLPFIRAINKNNFMGLFGVSEMRDTHGRIIRESRRAYFGLGATRYDKDALISGEDYEVPQLLQASRMFGLVQEVDVERNVQNANDFYLRSVQDFKKKSAELWKEYLQTSDKKEQERLLSEYFVQEALAEQVQADALSTALWLEARGEITGAQRREQEDLLKQLQAEYDIYQRR